MTLKPVVVLLLIAVLLAVPSAALAGSGGQCGQPYVVGNGETAADVAANCGISISDLQQANPDVNMRDLYAGQVLNLPGGQQTGSSQSGDTNNQPRPQPPSQPQGATPMQGGAMQGPMNGGMMGQAQGMGPEAPYGGPMQGNMMQGDMQMGEMMDEMTRMAQAGGISYIVRSGDTLASIAARFHTSVHMLAMVNSIHDPNRIWIGQYLVIPMAWSMGAYGMPYRGTMQYRMTPQGNAPLPCHPYGNGYGGMDGHAKCRKPFDQQKQPYSGQVPMQGGQQYQQGQQPYNHQGEQYQQSPQGSNMMPQGGGAPPNQASQSVPNQQGGQDQYPPGYQPPQPDQTPPGYQAPQGNQPEKGGQAPQGNQSQEGGQAPQSNQPEKGGQVPQSNQSQPGIQAPQGNQSQEGGQAPQSNQPEMGGQAPQSNQAQQSGQAPQTNQSQEGGQAPQTNPPQPGANAGPSGVTGYERVVQRFDNQRLAPNAEMVKFVDCPSGKKVVGGGGLVYGAVGRWLLDSSGPTTDTQWAIAFTNPTSSTVTAKAVEAVAICANLGQ